MNKVYTIIESGRTAPFSWRELWRFRELFWMLAWRNIIVRYKQTLLGLFWTLGRPLATVGAFYVLFHRIAKLPDVGQTPYPMLVFSGVMLWQLFSGMVSGGCETLVANRGLVTKVYFPRIIIPVSGLVVCMVDFLLTLLVFSGAYAIWCSKAFSWHIVLFPLALVPLLLCALGLVLFFSAANVRYRDFRHIVPFLLQLGLFVSPVGYSGTAIHSPVWRLVAGINPMYGVIGMARWALFGIPIGWMPAATSLLVSLLVFAVGFAVFRQQEKNFSDYI